MFFPDLKDVNRYILGKLEDGEILSLRLVNKEWNNFITRDSPFWEQKYLEKFRKETYLIRKNESGLWMNKYFNGRKNKIFCVFICTSEDTYDGPGFERIDFIYPSDNCYKVGEITALAIGQFKHKHKISKFGNYEIRDLNNTKISSNSKALTTQYRVFPIKPTLHWVDGNVYKYWT